MFEWPSDAQGPAVAAEISDRFCKQADMQTGQMLNSRHGMSATRLTGQRAQLRGTPVVGNQRNAHLAVSRKGAVSVRAEKVRKRGMHARASVTQAAVVRAMQDSLHRFSLRMPPQVIIAWFVLHHRACAVSACVDISM